MKRSHNKHILSTIADYPCEIKFDGKTYVIPKVPNELEAACNQLVSELTSQTEISEPLTKLKQIYDYLDDFNQFVSTFTVCSRGCAACCNINVSITELEAVYININTGVELSNASGHEQSSSNRCPFLSENNDCTIYSFRPFNCRVYHAVDDSKYCFENIDHVVYGCAGTNYGVRELVLLHNVLLDLNGNGSRGFIKEFFADRRTER
jgi:Fe-S-cluster containining protein